MRVPFSPYSATEFATMVWRRYTGPPSPSAPLNRSLTAPEAAPDVRIGFVGDICPLFGRRARFGPGVRAFLADCDVVVGNFEGVLTDRGWRPFLMRHTPDIFDVLARLKPLDCWVLSVANNHATDYGRPALARTLHQFDRHGIRWVGTTGHPRLQLLDGVTLTAWSRWMNRPDGGISRRDPGAPSPPGVHIAYPHWGYEHERQPRPDQSPPPGYALTVGHHPHLPQPLGREDGRLVAWSLGNFVTGNQLPVLGEGTVLRVGLCRTEPAAPTLRTLRYRELRLHRTRRQCRVRLRRPAHTTGSTDAEPGRAAVSRE